MLVLTTLPYLTDNVKVIPGVSDREAVTCNLQNNSHRTYLFHRADTELMLEDVNAFKDSFIQSDS